MFNPIKYVFSSRYRRERSINKGCDKSRKSFEKLEDATEMAERNDFDSSSTIETAKAIQDTMSRKWKKIVETDIKIVQAKQYREDLGEATKVGRDVGKDAGKETKELGRSQRRAAVTDGLLEDEGSALHNQIMNGADVGPYSPVSEPEGLDRLIYGKEPAKKEY